MRLPWQKGHPAAENAAIEQTNATTPTTTPGETTPYHDAAIEKESVASQENGTVEKSEVAPATEKAEAGEDATTAPGSSTTTPPETTNPPTPPPPPDEHAPEITDGGEGSHETQLAKTDTQTTTESIEDESKYPHGAPLYLLTFGLCLGTFVVALDNTIITTAIPKISTVFNSLDDVGWYGSAYLLTTAAFQPSLGKVYTFFNVKLTYVIAVATFELGSVLCGAARNSKMLIVGRAVAGLGASGIFSGAMTIVAYSVPLRKRSIYIAAVSSMFAIASVVGPIIGGALTDSVSWRWCFYINLPIGACCITIVSLFFKNPDRNESKFTLKQKILEIDLLGAFFLVGAVVCLLLALQWGGQTLSWKNSQVWGNFLGFGLIISVFCFIQYRRGDSATLPPRILTKQRTIIAVSIFSFFLALGFYVIIYYLPIWFQAVRGVSAEASGIRTIALLLSNILAAIVVGAAVSKIGYYTPFIIVGSAIAPVGSGLLYLLKVNSPSSQWIGYQILAGVSVGACIQLPFVAVQVVLSSKDMPVGNAVAVFFNTMGGAIGVSIAENVFDNSLRRYIPRYTDGVDAATVIAAGATKFRQYVPAAQLHGVLRAYNEAVVDTFAIAIASGGVAFLASFLFEWKSVKGKNLTAGGAA